jgi:hypothetical protein
MKIKFWKKPGPPSSRLRTSSRVFFLRADGESLTQGRKKETKAKTAKNLPMKCKGIDRTIDQLTTLSISIQSSC